MPYHKHETIDLLEIYHARILRNQLLRQLRRLSYDDSCVLGFDPQRRQEVLQRYEAMFAASTALLRSLGDEVSPA